MMLLVRHRVQDVDRWKRVFDREAAASAATAAAGLTVVQVWRSADVADEVFFLFEVEDRARAEAYMASPAAAAVGEEAGAIGGEVHWLEVLPTPGA